MSLSIHTIKQIPEDEGGGWSVGYWLHTSPGIFEDEWKWQDICQFKDIEDALRRVNLLNGGPGLASQVFAISEVKGPPWPSEPE